jgi:hypothetical protein
MTEENVQKALDYIRNRDYEAAAKVFMNVGMNANDAWYEAHQVGFNYSVPREIRDELHKTCIQYWENRTCELTCRIGTHLNRAIDIVHATNDTLREIDRKL